MISSHLRLSALLLALGVSAFAQSHKLSAPAKTQPSAPTSKPAAAEAVTDPDEYAVFAVPLAGLFDSTNFPNRKVIVKPRTLSFECGDKSCNLMQGPDGCSGMREKPDQDPELVLRTMRQSMTELKATTAGDFFDKNGKCATLKNDFPVDQPYLFVSDDAQQAWIGKQQVSQLSDEWKAADNVFFSQVGFNPDKTQALVYFSIVCHEKCGWFGYLLLNKESGAWKVVDHFQFETQ